VVQCREIVADGDPYPFLVLDVAGGGSLEEWVLSPESERASFDIHDLMTGIARGLAAAHRHNIYHYDLRPANILLSDDTDPLPKIAKFGMPRLETAQSAGGHMYLPPEAAGPGTKRAAAQDDVFAFGIIWHQVLTGKIERPPYDFVERLQRQGVAARCIRLVSRCLAHPDYRFKNGMELLDALEVEAVPLDWDVPTGCFDVSALAREYIESLGRQSPHAEA
jgi:serine/threonine protein kinase